MGMYYNIGGWKTFLPTDAEGNFKEGMRPRAALSNLTRDIKFNDMERGLGMERPWDTSGNDPLKSLRWSDKYRGMEKRLAEKYAAAQKAAAAKEAYKSHMRRKELEANPDKAEELRLKYAYEDATGEQKSMIEMDQDMKRMKAGSGTYGRSRNMMPAPGSSYRNRKK